VIAVVGFFGQVLRYVECAAGASSVCTSQAVVLLDHLACLQTQCRFVESDAVLHPCVEEFIRDLSCGGSNAAISAFKSATFVWLGAATDLDGSALNHVDGFLTANVATSCDFRSLKHFLSQRFRQRLARV